MSRNVIILLYCNKGNEPDRPGARGGVSRRRPGRGVYPQKFIFVFLFFCAFGRDLLIFGNISDSKYLTIRVLVTFSLAVLM